MSAVGEKVPATGSYNSAPIRNAGQRLQLVPSRPPATSTLPFGSRAAICPERALAIAPVAVNVPVAGSYSSAVASASLRVLVPPAMRTLPSGRSVPVWYRRVADMLPVLLNVPVAGSYTSALDRELAVLSG